MDAVRAYQPGDSGQVAKLWQREFGYPEARNDPARVVEEHLRHGNPGLLVAVHQGAVVGTVMAGYDGHRGWLYRLAVSPEMRRRGVGGRLVDAAQTWLRSQGCKKVNLQLHAHNQTALVFWRAVGFAEEARISMGKDLTNSSRKPQDAG